MKALSRIVKFYAIVSLFFLTHWIRGAEEGNLSKELKENPIRRLDFLKSAQFSNDCVFEFELIHYPRNGKNIIFVGQLFLSKEAMVMKILPRGGGEVTKILCKFGRLPRVWTLGNVIKELTLGELISPIVSNQLFNSIDLSRSFLAWESSKYEDFKRVKGRFSYLFLTNVPEELKKVNNVYDKVRIVIDSHFNSLLQVNYLNVKKEILRTFSILSFKKVDEEWIPKSIEIMDEITREKSRLTITSAAMNLKLPLTTFDLESIKKEFPVINKALFKTL